jgi:hypothetical protein
MKLAMIGANHFQIAVESDEDGVVVKVTHITTNQIRLGRPISGESCTKVEDRLRSELTATFYQPKEFRFASGRCQKESKISRWHQVEHLRSHRKKSMDTITSAGLDQTDLLDMFLEELWRDGLILLQQ